MRATGRRRDTTRARRRFAAPVSFAAVGSNTAPRRGAGQRTRWFRERVFAPTAMRETIVISSTNQIPVSTRDRPLAFVRPPPRRRVSDRLGRQQRRQRRHDQPDRRYPAQHNVLDPQHVFRPTLVLAHPLRRPRVIPRRCLAGPRPDPANRWHRPRRPRRSPPKRVRTSPCGCDSREPVPGCQCNGCSGFGLGRESGACAFAGRRPSRAGVSRW